MNKSFDTEGNNGNGKVVSRLMRKKNLAVVKYDPDTDTNFHDIDMAEFQKWQANHEHEYQEDLKIIKRLEAMCPRNESVYCGCAKRNNKQKKLHPFYSILYEFHQAANENYLEMYRFESSRKRKRYEALKDKAKQYLKTPPVFKAMKDDDISSILKEIGL